MVRPQFYLSTASFYFWNKGYDPLDSIDLIHSFGLKGLSGLDIYVDPDKSKEFSQGLTKKHREFLANYTENCIHTDFSGAEWGKNVDSHEMFEKFHSIAQAAHAIGTKNVVVHGDLFLYDPQQRLDLLQEAMVDCLISLEVMGKDKAFATHPDHLVSLLELAPDLYITPDLAHMRDWKDEYSWMELFLNPVLKDRIRFVHVSHHTSQLSENWYMANGHAECKDAVHSLVQCDASIFNQELRKILHEHKVVLEGILPVSDCVQCYLDKEMNLFL